MISRTILLICSFFIVVASNGWTENFAAAIIDYEAGDYSSAIRLFSPLAEQGHVEAQYYMGLMHHKGQGVPRDSRVAIRWYTAAAEQGHANAQNNLGFIYDNAQGVPRNYADALRWYTAAAEQGHANAQNNLGLIYTKGQGIPQDYVKAYAWYTVSGASGSKEGQDNRNTLVKQMTPEELEKGQQLAKQFWAQLGN